VEKTETKEPICNHDCLNCEHDDCINDAEPTEEEIRLSEKIDEEILISRQCEEVEKVTLKDLS